MSSDDKSSKRSLDTGASVEKANIGTEDGVVHLKHESELDISLALPGMTGEHAEDELDPAEASRVKRKLDLRILPLLCTLYTLQFLDKNAVGASTILGFISDNHLTIDQLNTLATCFYAGHLASQLLHAWALQKFPVAKYLTVMIFLWSLFVGLHCVPKNFGGLAALRFLLGAAEGCITPGLMLISSMFYTRVEMAQRIGWTFMCNGVAQIISGFIAFGVFHAPANTPEAPQKVAQWQWYFIVITVLTFVVCVIFGLLFPDSPTRAKFITPEEKVVVIKRMRGNQAGIETKVWKRHQFIEAFTDPKAYIFFFFAALLNLVGGVGTQYSIIISGFGFTRLQTTLLNMPSGACLIISISIGVYALGKFPNSRTVIALLSYIPSLLGSILLITLPKANKEGLLTSFYVMQLGQAPAVIMSLSWVTSTVSGHTKKLTMNSIWLVGYCVGQMLGPQFWKEKYKPNYTVPWAILLSTFVAQILLIFFLNWYLRRENARRDQLEAAARAAHPSSDGKTRIPELEPFEEYAWVDLPNGEQKRVEKRFLDLTDGENLAFRYVL